MSTLTRALSLLVLLVAACGGAVRYDASSPAARPGDAGGFRVPSCTVDASGHHSDSNGDGRHDTVSVRENGAEVCRFSDSNFDGKLDTVEHFDQGRLVHRAVDTDGDGHADRWHTYPDAADPGCVVTDTDHDKDGHHDAAHRTHTCKGGVVGAFSPKPLRFMYALPAATPPR